MITSDCEVSATAGTPYRDIYIQISSKHPIEPDHFELVPKTPHSARKRTPAKPLLYADEPAVLPASPSPLVADTTSAITDFNVTAIPSEPQQPNTTDSPKPRKPTVFERLFHIKGDPAATPKRQKTAPRPSAKMPPARSKKPLTVPEEFHFRTDQRIAMKRHDFVPFSYFFSFFILNIRWRRSRSRWLKRQVTLVNPRA